VGFTAWSSVREPCQVFVLLETVYHAFDQIAKRRGVFKVETVGDCYVAVAGLPEPRTDHAVAMARFAHDCNVKLHRLVKQLEVTLGPDTGDLSMRFGLHSGPVTAGVLRGERSHFQLFGDTVNTAARVETTGEQGHIHMREKNIGSRSAKRKSWRREKVNCRPIG
jgi:class 3 adenylate cyclase